MPACYSKPSPTPPCAFAASIRTGGVAVSPPPTENSSSTFALFYVKPFGLSALIGPMKAPTPRKRTGGHQRIRMESQQPRDALLNQSRWHLPTDLPSTRSSAISANERPDNATESRSRICSHSAHRDDTHTGLSTLCFTPNPKRPRVHSRSAAKRRWNCLDLLLGSGSFHVEHRYPDSAGAGSCPVRERREYVLTSNRPATATNDLTHPHMSYVLFETNRHSPVRRLH